MPRNFFAALAILLFLGSNGFVEDEKLTAIVCGQLLDVRDGSLTPGKVILVRDERIAGIESKVPQGATVVDLSAYTVLPGLIDSHTHILLQPEDEGEIPPVITKSQAFRTVQGVAAARKELEAGFTTLRDVDSEGAGFADVAIRDAINQQIVPGPRLLVSTLALSITAGHMNIHGMNPDLAIPEPAALVDSPEAMVAEIRRQVKYGADWIKLYATGTLRHINPETMQPVSQVSLEEAKAVVQEAARWGKDVAAHAYGGDGAKNCIVAGVRSIEHGMLLTDELLDLMVQRGTFWCPTLSVYIPAKKEDETELTMKVVANHRQVFQNAMAKGVNITFGTDVGAYEHGTSVREFERMVEYGMPNLKAIQSATLMGSKLLRMEKQIGTIEAGKYADIIAVRGNPLTDIKALRSVEFVMKAGHVYKQK